IVFCIANGIDRFGAMLRAIPGITKQMLTQQLREMERDGLLDRTVFPVVPPRVDYTLTGRGRSLLPVIVAMRDWGEHDLRPAASRSPPRKPRAERGVASGRIAAGSRS